MRGCVLSTDRRRTVLRGVGAAGLLAALGFLTAAPAAWAGPNSGKVAFSVGSDITTAYFFRGILQERNGFIWQPYGEINVNAYSTDEEHAIVTGITPFVGSWNSVHSKDTLGTNAVENWYESDVYAGVKFNLFNTVEMKPFYIAYTYPNGAFPTVGEADLQFTLFDAQWLDKWALNPSVLFAWEFDNTAFGTNEGTYAQVSVRPSYTIYESETYPVTMAIPLNLGLSVSEYYETDTRNPAFGFFQGGAIFTVPLAFVPEDYGAWSVSAGASLYAFGTTTKQANDNDTPWVVGTWSLNFAY